MTPYYLAVFSDGDMRECRPPNAYQRWCFREPTSYGHRYGWAPDYDSARRKAAPGAEIVECITATD